MVYSSESDFADLTRKLDTVGKLGVSCFALFLDDVPAGASKSRKTRRDSQPWLRRTCM